MSALSILISSIDAIIDSRHNRLSISLLLLITILFLGSDQVLAATNSPTILGSIAGVVKDENQQPLAGIEVVLHTVRNKYALIQTTTVTDLDGSYRASLLPTGNYQLRFHDPQGIYPTQYYTSAQWLEDADPVFVMSNDITDIDMTLRRGGHITGLVTLDGEIAPLRTNTKIQFFVFNRDAWQMLDELPLTSASGIYTSSPLLPGIYRVCGSGTLPFTYLVLFHCFGGSSLDTAQNVTVTVGGIHSDTNLELLENEVSGLISGTVTSDNAQLSGINVTLYKDYTEGIITPFARTTTNQFGNYLFAGVLGGNYHAHFSDPNKVYASQFYALPTYRWRSIPLSLQYGTIISAANVSLVQAGTIEGMVVDATHAPLGGVQVRAWISETVVGSFGQTRIDWHVASSSATTDETGHYTITDMLPGVYRLSFDHCQLDVNQIWRCNFDYYSDSIDLYGNYGYIALPLASDVFVLPGDTTNGIDLLFGRENPIFLPLVQR